MGFPSQPIHFLTSPLPLGSTPAPPLALSVQSKCLQGRQLAFSPACLCLSLQVPPGPFCSRHSSPRLKRRPVPRELWELCGIRARDAKEYMGWSWELSPMATHQDVPAAPSWPVLQSLLPHHCLELFISSCRETKDKVILFLPELTVLLIDLRES